MKWSQTSLTLVFCLVPCRLLESFLYFIWSEKFARICLELAPFFCFQWDLRCHCFYDDVLDRKHLSPVISIIIASDVSFGGRKDWVGPRPEGSLICLTRGGRVAGRETWGGWGMRSSGLGGCNGVMSGGIQGGPCRWSHGISVCISAWRMMRKDEWAHQVDCDGGPGWWWRRRLGW